MIHVMLFSTDQHLQAQRIEQNHSHNVEISPLKAILVRIWGKW